jgi:hypothetical protein
MDGQEASGNHSRHVTQDWAQHSLIPANADMIADDEASEVVMITGHKPSENL